MGNFLLVSALSIIGVPKSRHNIYWKGFLESLGEPARGIAKHNKTCPCTIPPAHVSGTCQFHIIFSVLPAPSVQCA